MAFQTGTTVDPRLGQLDYSGFARAGEIEGQAMAQAGASIASGIKGYKKKKKEEKIGQAKINRSIAFGESMIDMLGEDHPLSDSIADSLAMSFGENVPFEQKIAATEGLSTEITNMFLMNQKTQDITTMMTPAGTEVMMRGGEVIGKTTPYQQSAGGGNFDAIRGLFNDDERKELEELRRQRDLAAQQVQP
tara:strand:+ start:1505 stop:2077 length:573 start_codon:yes stop_codon:yes gene_type:complete